MQKKNLTIATAVVSAAMIVGVLATVNHNNILTAFAGIQENEYGCAGNCTGEYEIQHVKTILKDNPELNGSKNVRFLVKYTASYNGYQWYQDIFDDNNFNMFNIDANAPEHLMSASGISNGLDSSKFSKGDTIGLVGTVNLIGSNLQITEVIYYKWNNTVNTNLLPPVNYLQ